MPIIKLSAALILESFTRLAKRYESIRARRLRHTSYPSFARASYVVACAPEVHQHHGISASVSVRSAESRASVVTRASSHGIRCRASATLIEYRIIRAAHPHAGCRTGSDDN